MSPDKLLLFTSIALIAALSPGPAILLVTTNSVRYGVRRSILTMLGNISGLFIMSLLAVLGLSTMILMSSHAFLAIKVIGAAYLVYLGVRLWRYGLQLNTATQEEEAPVATQPPRSLRLYIQGLMVALSNPKAIAFTTALFPQFIDASRPLALQFSILVTIFMLLSFICLLGYGLLAARSAARIRHRARTGGVAGKLFGSVFIGSGIALALTSR